VKKKKEGNVLWLLGPSSSGKTTIGQEVARYRNDMGVSTLHFDGDEIRGFFGGNLGFKDEDRLRAVSICVHLANKAAAVGVDVVVSALTAREDARSLVKQSTKNLILIYLSCPVDVCIARDSRGIYAKALSGQVDKDTVIGLSTPYLAPKQFDLMIETDQHPIDVCVSSVLTHLHRRGHSPSENNCTSTSCD
jgi:adenylylsulfate kinase